MSFDQLKLDNQLCFHLYAASRLITREYQPFLDELGITYPQYLVFMVLWEKDGVSVNEISQKLILNTNTVTPLLKRMESSDFISRERCNEDERRVIVKLTEKGRAMEIEAAKIPKGISSCILSDEMKMEDLMELKDKLHELIDVLKK
ncbi:MarR family transcriptional regulator [Marinifilum sp. N1E240]|uniref:MarR family winged helix-turn-helix transcriptional regulator n=1 Tax=Marinifilum sp. N1E240 TaxID=2608082 RepID=UPI00128CC18B|nr:MarR family transcriptional regulator [Marinifilum sp. N1E240]MPQ49257.1 MarR family transcriptional regulator [Marinifilum sp. N1E240]